MSFKDGNFTIAGQNWPRVPSYPFANYPIPDLLAAMYERDMMVLSASLALSIGQRSSITNLFTQSEDDEHADWTKASATVTANSVANPNDGQLTANSLLEAAATAEHTITQSQVITANPVTFFRVLKANGRNWARLKITDSGANVFSAFFDLVNGVVGTVSGAATAVIVPIPGATGWYLCALTAGTPASGGASFLAQPSTDGVTISYAGDITKGLFLYAAQATQTSSWQAYIHTSTTSRTGSAPLLEINEAQEGSDPFAFLVREDTAPKMELIVAHFVRRHSRVPGPQVSYPGSQYIPLPDVVNNFGDLNSLPVLIVVPIILNAGDAFFDVDAGALYTEHDTSLYGPMKAITGRVAGYATAGTFTLTYGASTTAALNYNDSGATIAAAINGLASIISAGLVASVTSFLTDATGGSLLITWTTGGTATQVTMNAGSLTTSTSSNPTTQVSTVLNQSILLPDHLTIAGHGFPSGTVPLAAVNQIISTAETRVLIQPAAAWGVIDSNTIWAGTSGTVSTYLYAGPFKAAYTPGETRLLRTKVTEYFFLAGVTLGIDSPADIPVPADLQQSAAFASAIVNQTGFAVYRSEGPQPWMDSLIYVLREVEINLSDINGA